jgi:DNA-binding transcriptional LysR family regulator
MWQLNDVNVFVAIVETGSFVGASKRLNMPSSTVSRRVAELESALDLKLLERNARQLNITQAGKRIYEQASGAFDSLKNEIDLLTDTQDELTGLLTVTCPVYLGQSELGAWLREFAEQHPGIDLKVMISDGNENFADHEIDIAIRLGPLADSKLYAQYLFTSENQVVATPEFLAKKGVPKTPVDLSDFPLILMSQAGGKIQFMQNDTTETVLKFKPKIESNDITFLRQCVLEHYGIASLPKLSICKPLEQGELINLFPKTSFLPRRDLYTLYSDKRYLSRKARLLISFLKNKTTAFR